MGASPAEFLGFFDTLASVGRLFPKIAPGQYNTSTMTVLAESDQKVDLSRLGAVEDRENLDILLDTGGIHPDCPGGELKVKWQKRRQKKVGEFGNQLTLCFESWSKRSIKVFSKGGIHMAGVKNLTEFERVGHIISGLLFAIGAVDKKLVLGAPKVVMLNFNFSLNCELSLEALARVALQQLGVVATHETESHPAMMMRFVFQEGQPTTAMVFRSGKVLITSSSQLGGVLACYRLICQLVNDNLEGVQASVKLWSYCKKKTGEKRVLDGYLAGQALPCYPLWKRSCNWEDVVSVSHT